MGGDTHGLVHDHDVLILVGYGHVFGNRFHLFGRLFEVKVDKVSLTKAG
jgi:hypothetical protein